MQSTTINSASVTSSYLPRSSIQVAVPLCQFIEQEVLPDLNIEAGEYWQQFSALLKEFSPINKALLEKREALQIKIDEWNNWHGHAGADEQLQFLKDIGYLVNEPDAFSIGTTNVDQEIATIAGPQLVVPLKNARYALNAANARWGSLYDALYGSDVIPRDDIPTKNKGYDPVRGGAVIKYAREFLNQTIPLEGSNHFHAIAYSVAAGRLIVEEPNGRHSGLVNPDQFIGYTGTAKNPTSVILRNHGLCLELCFDRQGNIGNDDHAGMQDILLESALTTIQDCEDSVAAVDAEDKTEVYRNWLGLMRGNLTTKFKKGNKSLTRGLVDDKEYVDRNDEAATLPSRSLLLIRNVGHLMNNDAVLDQAGNPIPEGIMDGLITSTIALYDLRKINQRPNSRTGSLYIVKPKMHGPEEVSFSCNLFNAIESMLSIPKNTIKIGIMDEERRTTLNLKACIHAAKERVIFINTGFLDRTGDEIHTAMDAGPMVPKAQMKNTAWIQAYETANVDIGLQCGFSGRAQIGKGMWAMPDEMAKMMASKIEHPRSAANCAWVPSPTAATLHAMHYHQVDVLQLQQEKNAAISALSADHRLNQLRDLVTLPIVADPTSLTAPTIKAELDNNIQSLLGYVVRWINDGVGCSKVPDINNVGLMEDRATLRISSQHIANWLHHGICSHQQVQETLERMAKIVDQQNSDDPDYQCLARNDYNNIAFQAASALIFQGREQPSGYTEPLLHAMRKQQKNS